MNFLIVTGLSGAGKSMAVNALEDIGFFCIDNIPAGLLPRILDFAQQGENQLSRVAVVMDIRGLHSVQETNEALEALDEKKMPYDILFLDASDAAIRRRYKETRRVHPMTISEGIPVSEAITKERQILQPLRERAKYVIDTSLLSTAQNRERVSSLFLQKGQCAMSINVVSFGFKYGLPQEADIVFDVRCLPNPFYVPELKEKTGLDQEVVDYVMKFPESQELLRRIESFLEYALPLYVKEGKSQLMIAIGCTGGKHRSITFARKIGEYCTKLGTVISKERGTGLIYEFSVKDPEQVQKMLNLFGHTGRETTLRIRPDCFKCQKCGSFFISTAFLCCGTATDPEKEYNIEFLSPRHSLSQQLEGILAQYEFNPHRAVRKGANTVYVKSSDHLEDLLTFMGAGNAAMRIMEQRMYNDMRNKTNRLSNCETANMGKTVQAAVQVRLAIETLEEAGALETLPKPLQQAARLRMQYPEMPLAKLAEKFDPPVSKAGLSHRFKRIQEAAARLNAAASAQPEEQENLKEPEPAGQDIAPSPQ